MTFIIQDYPIKVRDYHVTANLEGGLWFGECVELRGCVAQGNNLIEFVGNMHTAIADYTTSLRNDDLVVPAPYPETISTGNATTVLYGS